MLTSKRGVRELLATFCISPANSRSYNPLLKTTGRYSNHSTHDESADRSLHTTADSIFPTASHDACPHASLPLQQQQQDVGSASCDSSKRSLVSNAIEEVRVFFASPQGLCSPQKAKATDYTRRPPTDRTTGCPHRPTRHSRH